MTLGLAAVPLGEKLERRGFDFGWRTTAREVMHDERAVALRALGDVLVRDPGLRLTEATLQRCASSLQLRDLGALCHGDGRHGDGTLSCS